MRAFFDTEVTEPGGEATERQAWVKSLSLNKELSVTNAFHSMRSGSAAPENTDFESAGGRERERVESKSKETAKGREGARRPGSFREHRIRIGL